MNAFSLLIIAFLLLFEMAFITIEVPDWEFPRLSNQTLLLIALFTFSVFAIVELFGALESTSLSLLGDSVAMFVDVITYICNGVVEWYKSRNNRITQHSRLFMEVIIPSLSVLSLIAVTLYVTYDAVRVVLNPPVTNTVDVGFLYGFSMGNIFVDLFCSYLFYLRRNDVFEEKVMPHLSLDTSIFDDEFGDLEKDIEFEFEQTQEAAKEDENNSSLLGCFTVFYHLLQPHNHDDKAKANLNMLSALAHIFGDTIRTISEFLAASISSISGIDGDICDAWAAIVVAISILVVSGRLIIEIIGAFINIYSSEHRAIPLMNLSNKNSQSYQKLNIEDEKEENVNNHSKSSH